MTDDVAIAHRGFDFRGGGEVVVETLARHFDAPVYCWSGTETAPDDIDTVDITDEFGPVQRRLFDRGFPLSALLARPLWERIEIDAEVVITSGDIARWYLPERHSQSIVAYCHSPQRWQTDLFRTNPTVQARIWNRWMRLRDMQRVCRPDVLLANSDVIRRRMDQYWPVESDDVEVVYPPVETAEYGRERAETTDDWLCLGRLDQNKHVCEVIDAYAAADVDGDLLIAGDGPLRDAAEQRAASVDGARVLGYVTESRKRDLLSQARAAIMNAAAEDFGIVPVEAMASGTPVIGVDEGFTREQIIDGANGLVFPRGELVTALVRFDAAGVEWAPKYIEEFARRNFDTAVFLDGIERAVEHARDAASIDADLELPATQEVMAIE